MLGLTLMASAVTVQADSLKDIKHIILFMQENRSFDHVCPHHRSVTLKTRELAAETKPSISAPWPGFATLVTPMYKSTMALQSGDSEKVPVHFLFLV